MIKPYRKKLIEVALPLAKINEAAAREKSIRHGHPSTLHLWWARRPLAACRAVLFSSLVDDPESDPELRGDEALIKARRVELFSLIEELVQWENSNNPRVINAARAEIARSVASWKIEKMEFNENDTLQLPNVRNVTARDIVNRTASTSAVSAFLTTFAPPVLDPFCGGGSIPLEAQRLGLRTYASDLNPVACLITQALIEIPPKFAGMSPVNPAMTRRAARDNHKANLQGDLPGGRVWEGAQGLAADIRYYGQWLRHEAEKRIGHLYPKVKVTREMAKDRPDLTGYVGEELTVIAWLWARTIQCPNPGCRARTPLVRSFWLSTKKGQEVFAQPHINTRTKTIRFSIQKQGEPPKNTTDRSGARCLFCDTFIKKPQLRELAVEHGVTEIPLAIVVELSNGRVYLDGECLAPPSVNRPTTPFLDQPMTNDKRWFSPPLYGLPNFSDLFTARQLVALTAISDLVGEAREQAKRDAVSGGMSNDVKPLAEGGIGATAYADAVATYLTFGVSKATDYNCNLVSWITQRNQARSTFSKQALPMIWDYCEVNPFAGAAGDPNVSLDGIGDVLSSLVASGIASTRQVDATAAIVGPRSPVISTDPPYYDNIGYADLSDFFYVWLRRSLVGVHPSLFATLLTPKVQELIASPNRHDGKKEQAQAFFEHGLGSAFERMRQAQSADFPLTVYYAFKQVETDEDDPDYAGTPISVTASTGWETMLAGLIRAGFSIHGTWPMRTERSVRSIGLGTNALASSVILVCRPRLETAPVATRKQYVLALRQELPNALRDLRQGNIAPVDLAQAAIGPGMAVFTRFSKVLESDGTQMTVRTALGLINQSLDEVLAEQEGDFDGDTRWALAWFEQYGVNEGPFGEADVLCRAKNTAVNGLVEAGVIAARAGKVRLVRRDELPVDWDPNTERRLTVWESMQHLIHELENEGESKASELVQKLGGLAETCRDLAYRLYTICERKKWADEARAYNGLVIVWPELAKLALAQRESTPERQTELF